MTVGGYRGDLIGWHKGHADKLTIATDPDAHGGIATVGVVCEQCKELVTVLDERDLAQCLDHFDEVVLTYYGGYDKATNPLSVTIECHECGSVIVDLFDRCIEQADMMDEENGKEEKQLH